MVLNSFHILQEPVLILCSNLDKEDVGIIGSVFTGLILDFTLAHGGIVNFLSIVTRIT
jgi:hypothetical protein